MRILMTVSSTSLMDGINRHILAIVPALNALPEVEVGVVTLHPWGDFNNALKSAGVRCWALGCANGHQLKVIPRFCRVMREFRPDIIHAHVLAYFESLALKWFFPQVGMVSTIHGIGDPVTFVPYWKRMLRVLGVTSLCRIAASRNVDATVFISAGVKNAFAKKGYNGEVVYNPIAFIPQDDLRTNGRKVIGTACRFAGQKNLEAMVRVMIAVTAQSPFNEAWLIGDGLDIDLNERLRDIVKAAHAEDRVKFFGYQRDAISFVRQMMCFVMTSHWEGMPTALLEAMSVKTPIAFMEGEGGLQDLAEMNRQEGPFAVVVAPGDEAGMIKGICELLNDPQRAAAYAERAFEVGRRHFELSTVVRQIKNVYDKVGGRK